MESSEGRAGNHRRRWGLFSTFLVSCDLVPLVSCDLGPRGSKGEGGQGRGTGGGGGGCMQKSWGVERLGRDEGRDRRGKGDRRWQDNKGEARGHELRIGNKRRRWGWVAQTGQDDSNLWTIECRLHEYLVTATLHPAACDS